MSASTALGSPDLDLLQRRYFPDEARIGSSTTPSVLEHARLAALRKPGQICVNVLAGQETEGGVGAIVQVVTDDTAFVVQTIAAVLARHHLALTRLDHPVVAVRRDAHGRLQRIAEPPSGDSRPDGVLPESWVSVALEAPISEHTGTELTEDIRNDLTALATILGDAETIDRNRRRIADRLESAHPAEAQFLRWLTPEQFTVVGYTSHRGGSVADTRGLLRAAHVAAAVFAPGPLGDPFTTSATMSVTYSSHSVRVPWSARPSVTAVVVVTDRDTSTEHRFVGILTPKAARTDVLDVPRLRESVRWEIVDAGHELGSFSGQRALEALQSYPRTDLLAADHTVVAGIIASALELEQPRANQVFLRSDPAGRFVSILVRVPREGYSTRTRESLADLFLSEFDGDAVEFTSLVTDGGHAQLHLLIRTPRGATIDADVRRRLDMAAATVGRTWDDRVLSLAVADARIETARAVDYLAAFSEAYKEDLSPEQALEDILRLRKLAPGAIDVRLHRDPEHRGQLRFVLYLAAEGIALSELLPVLQSLGVSVLDERPYAVAPAYHPPFWIYDLRLAPTADDAVDDKALVRIEQAFRAVWCGDAEADAFNSLVLAAGLDWRESALLRAYAAYLRQVRLPYSASYIHQVLLTHPRITAALVELFRIRFTPHQTPHDPLQPGQHADQIRHLIDEVTSLDADRILRAFLSVIAATLRTNFFVRGADGNPRGHLSVKLDPSAITDVPVPEPRPKFEIFVHSPHVEGVHLRFGSVARGGLRWSDRQEDYRTEILGLVKAQAVKNAVIVPVGAKGGFVVKRAPATTGDDRGAQLTEGQRCYRTFIAGLLDVTDNIDAATGAVGTPTGVVRYDNEDPYLVVAADKGTAAFSDHANAVAADYHFWLGDAFASGGSVGYDHKAMGITAKGAWESVKRHFRELGHNTQTTDFTVVGIGDMSGDVFGNGMLLSRHIRLVAAFDHRHIFLDPTPDAAGSFDERARLFSLERSSWADYDRSRISTGGGVFSRSAKIIHITDEVRAALGLDSAVHVMTPVQLVRAILTAPVDLLWNGGIGTYVKSGTETHLDVGDKANEDVRVNGTDLRVEVVGEGGNLGLTQRGRIEFARGGGKINTDALDNSAGVDCSDHEVNIKIVLDSLVSDGRLDRHARSILLAKMTDEVAALVLNDNINQNELMGISRVDPAGMLGVQSRLIDDLEAHHGLNRALETLPDREQILDLERSGLGLSSPELATLMAHVKLSLKTEMLATALPEADVFASQLPHYFPIELSVRYPDAIAAHTLRREIVTTMVVNDIVETGGISYVFRLQEETGASATDAIRAHAATSRIFDLVELRRTIFALEDRVPAAVTDELSLATRRLLDHVSRWMLSNRPQPLAVGAEVARFRDTVTALVPMTPRWLRGSEAEALQTHIARLTDSAVPTDVAAYLVSHLHAPGLLDVTEIADLTEHDPHEVGELYYALSDLLGIDRITDAIFALPQGDRWHYLARLSLHDEILDVLRALTIDVVGKTDPADSIDDKIDDWRAANAVRIARTWAALTEIAAISRPSLAALSVAVNQVRGMVRGLSQPALTR